LFARFPECSIRRHKPGQHWDCLTALSLQRSRISNKTAVNGRRQFDGYGDGLFVVDRTFAQADRSASNAPQGMNARKIEPGSWR
jgi:hypothetical protein